MKEQVISKTDNIQEIVMKYPETIDVFMSYGLHCIGCHISATENIEEGCRGHCFEDSTIDSLITDLNETVSEKGEIQELKITKKAIDEITNLMSQEGKGGHDLRIVVSKNGDSFAYDFEFEMDSRKTNDREYDFHGVHVLVGEKSFELLKGTKIDFIANDFEQGFKIINPNDSSSITENEHTGCGF